MKNHLKLANPNYSARQLIMKILSCSILILSLTACLNSQIFYSDTLSTIAYWQQGETYTYQLDKQKIKQTDDELVNSNSSSLVTFYIQEETDSNYLIQCNINSVTIKSQKETNPILYGLSTEHGKHLTYLLETDENGSLIELKNWRELKEQLLEIIPRVKEFSEMDRKQKKKLKETLKTMTDSKQKIQSLLIKDFSVLFSNYGFVFNTKDTIEYTQELPNNYGGDPFLISGHIYFDTKGADTTNSVMLYDKNSVDKETGKKALIHVSKQLLTNPEQADADWEKVEFIIEESEIQQFDINNGSIIYALSERIIRTNDLNQKIEQTSRSSWKLIKVE